MQARKETEISHDGRTVYVRSVASADSEALGRMLSRLSQRTIYERFHASYPKVPGWAPALMTEADHRDRESLVGDAADPVRSPSRTLVLARSSDEGPTRESFFLPMPATGSGA